MTQLATSKNGQVQRGEQPETKRSLAQMLMGMKDGMAAALPRHMTADRMLRITLTALRTNPKLQQCNPSSFLASVMQAGQLGLEVNTPLGQAYLIPRKDECTMLIGYQGYLDLARRSGEVAAIYAEAVFKGDEFSYELGLDRSLKHKPSEEPGREDGPLTHVYAVAKLKTGEALFVVLTRAQVERYRKRGSNSSSTSPWNTDYEAMAKKTAIRRLFTWIPKSAEMAQAVAIDEAQELGRAQTVALTPESLDVLAAHGVQLADEHDPETGEVPAAEEST